MQRNNKSKTDKEMENKIEPKWFENDLGKVEKGYRMVKIDGGSVVDFVRQLHEYSYIGEKVCFIVEQGRKKHKFYSDTVTIELVWMKMWNETYESYQKRYKELGEKYDLECKEFEKNKPELIEQYYTNGIKYIDESLWDEWKKIIEIRVNDIYQGMDVRSVIELLPLVNDDKFLHANKIFEEQGHSGWSGSIVLAMLKKFSPLGEKFYKFMEVVLVND